MIHFKAILVTPLLLCCAILQAQDSKIKFSKSPSGLEYKLFTAGKGPKVAGGDLVYFKFKGVVSDSTLYNSYRNTQMPYMSFALKESFPKANFEEGLSLMCKGDSALFLVNVDSFFKIYAGAQSPSFVKPGDKLHFYVKVDSFVTKNELAMRKLKEEQEMKDRITNESTMIEEFVKSTGLKFNRTNTGLYYVITKESTGEKASQGDKVGAIYTGKLFSGKVFDSNKSSGNAFEFTLGAHQVIAGWDEIFGILKVGETATIVLPSSLAYGARGAGADIKPYTPLVFDVEFIKLTPATSATESATVAPQSETDIHSEDELAKINKYIIASGLKFSKTPTGLYYRITQSTQGAKANVGDVVAAFYTGKLLDGKVFDSNKSSGNPFEFTLGAHQVIAGWDEIFAMLKVGEAATILLPSNLAYGATGAGGVIPPYAPLIFDVEFVKYTPGQR